ncbi:MAG: BatD family protein [Gemmatimonadaceae bacterium]|nr:BatD family protein [Gemmatimonadaceae bacterium]
MVGGILLAALLAQAPPQGALPEVITRSAVAPRRGVDFHALLVPDTVYVGEQATYELGVFLDQDVRQRIRRNPEFLPSATPSLLSYDLRERRSGAIDVTVGGRAYEAHAFRRALFALSPGRYPIAQASLTYSLPQTSSFFSRDENYALRSEPVVLVAIEPPVAGRPPDWTGAVGSWRASARLDTARGRAGDPLVLTVRIEGQGNVTLLPRPRLNAAWATVANADERVMLDSTAPFLGGWKEFDWLVTPTAVGTQEIPSVRYPYFNPRTRRYEVASTAPLAVRVAAGSLAAAPLPSALPDSPAAPPAIFSSAGRSAPVPLARNPLVLALAVLAPLAASGAAAVRRPRRPRPSLTPGQRLDAAAALDPADAARSVRLALVDGIARRTGIDVADATMPGALTLALRKVGLSASSGAMVESLLGSLDAACFAGATGSDANWVTPAREALRLIDAEACAGPRTHGGALGTGAIAVLALTAALSAGGAGAQEREEAFARGATAYAGGDFLRAVRYFADAARAQPRSVAAWANMGTAAMLAGDTASAVVGWQRALRLAPLNDGLRAQLARVRAPQDSGPARVFPVPEWAATSLALLLWAGGWGLVARQAWRRKPAWRLALLTAVAGGAALAAAARVESNLAGRNVAVITAPAPLRSLPALGAEAEATPLLGEVAEVLARDGVWVRVRLQGGREGWIPAERVTSLAAD